MEPLTEADSPLVRRAEFENSAVRKDARFAYGIWLVAGILDGQRAV